MIVSEWIDGSTLDDFADGPKAMSGDKIYSTGSQMLSALTYLEDQGVVHRDIKPANVMIDGSGAIKLIDFNLTRETGFKTLVAGTPAYMPPDFLAQSDSVDSFVDRYGVGVILYELALGAHPYASYLANRGRPGLSATPTDPAALRTDVSPALSSFLVRAVAPLESGRFTSAGEMATAWASVADDVRHLK
jgi:serine/threonine-protein kinase